MASLPALPEDGNTLEASHPSLDVLKLLALRRSTLARNMTGPGPAQEQLDDLIRLASRVPDHGKLSPWRFIIFQEGARSTFGDVLADRFQETEPSADEERTEFERDRFTRAPVVVAVVSCAAPHVKVPEWEQVLSAGAVCQNLLIAASAMGFAAQWITEWYAYDPIIKSKMGLSENEKIAGFIYLGQAVEPLTERKRPLRGNLVTHWPSYPRPR